MITQKMKYALKALLVLADEAAKGQPEPLTIEEIAKRSDTPKRFLEHILLEVRNAGVIASIRGRSGGYILIKKPTEVSISELLRTIDGPIAPLPCLSRRAYQRCEDCADE
ncbi:MAG: Rrf2 family transcriptional regulator, partial [Rhodobacter sp.]|nr:Rrf2 family transcriptional regulator [Rhodobacter sp.]